MKSCLLFLTVFAILFSPFRQSVAQCVYDFTVFQDTYMPLTVAQSLNDTNVWDDVNYKKDMGFSCDMDWTQISKFSLVNNIKGEFIGVDTTSLFNGFLILDADLEDRGKLGDTVSKSSIRYLVDMENGKKILKIEYYNAGFWRERDLYNTMDDSVNIQVWLYESDNAIEIRFGNARISHASDYFVYGTGGGPVIGFVRDGGLYSLNVSALYYLRGNPANPVIDSCISDINNVVTALDSFPPAGTVYRFKPQPNAVNNVEHALNGVSLRNTISKDVLEVVNNENMPVRYQAIALNGAAITINGELDKGWNKIDISSLPNGVYALHFISGNSHTAMRFIKI